MCSMVKKIQGWTLNGDAVEKNTAQKMERVGLGFSVGWALTLSVCFFSISPAFCRFLLFVSAYSVCCILMCFYLFISTSLSFTLGMCMLLPLVSLGIK